MLYITIVLAIAVETLGLQLLLTTKITVAAALALNTAAAIFPAFGAYLLRKAGKSPYDCALVSLFTLTLPGIGLYGCFMAILLSKTVIRNKGLAHDLEKNDYIPPLVPNEKIGNRNTFIEQELGVEPIVDILRGTDSGLKRGAIKVLGNLQSREAVTLLRKCLKDPDPEIRFMHTRL